MRVTKKQEQAAEAHIRKRLAEKQEPGFKDFSQTANRDAARLYPDPAKAKKEKDGK